MKAHPQKKPIFTYFTLKTKKHNNIFLFSISKRPYFMSHCHVLQIPSLFDTKVGTYFAL